MVLEFGDIDLARLLLKREKGRKEAGLVGVDGHFIRLYWQQMLQVIALAASPLLVSDSPCNVFVACQCPRQQVIISVMYR